MSGKNVTPQDQALSLELTCEYPEGLSAGAVHKLWAIATIRARYPGNQQQEQQQPQQHTNKSSNNRIPNAYFRQGSDDSLLRFDLKKSAYLGEEDSANNKPQSKTPPLYSSFEEQEEPPKFEMEQNLNRKSRNSSISDFMMSETANRQNGIPVNPGFQIGIDFVVVIDHSSSMKLNNKLAYVQATIEYLISELREWHRFGLIQFNQDSQVLSPLVEMTPENKSDILRKLRTIKAEGSTNLSQPLIQAISELHHRAGNDRFRISSIMLFTDGLANTGLKGSGLVNKLLDMKIPAGLTINTFGYGSDHDSSTLQSIALASKGGVYHYIESPEIIASTFGECVSAMTNTAAHNIDVRIQGQDGCRIINFYTKFPVETKEDVKDYVVSIGSMYAEESKSILMKLSLRKMSPMTKHQLLKVTIT